MKNRNTKDNKILKFIVCIALPYILINGLILFLFIDKPDIIILNSNQDNIKEIRFVIKHILPLESISITNNEEEVYYYKDNREYIVPIEHNGTYKISVSTINKMINNMYIDINTQDDVNPSINIEDATYSAGTLTINVEDSDSGINYDSIYGLVDDEKTLPTFIDKATGTIKFKLSKDKKMIIHIEDLAGNTAESEIIGN